MPIPVRVFPDIHSLAETMAEHLAGFIRSVVEKRGQCALALAGGNSPRVVYEGLAQQSSQVPWPHVHLFWGDERYVPHDHPLSNYRMAYESLLSRIDIPAGNVHPIPTHFTEAEDAAKDYETTLRHFLTTAPAAFDLILLGMGPDGHTASLFPGTTALDENSRLVIPVTAPIEPPLRISVTMPVILQARAIYFIVTGKDKAATLRHVHEEPGAGNKYPSGRVFEAASQKTVCWADQAAAANLSSQLL